MKRWTRVTLLAAAAALCLSLSLPACAAAYDYDYELDPQTGEPIDPAGGSGSFYELADGARYIYDTGRYVYQTGSAEFASSIPNNGVVGYGQSVSLWTDNASAVLAYRDGGLLESPTLQGISQPGSYVVHVSASDSLRDFVFYFTIVPELTSQFTELSLPEGFLLDYVLLDTIPQELPYGDFYRVSGDGAYDIQYSCAALDQSVTLRFTLDTIPPALELTGVVNGEAFGAVTVAVPEEGAQIEINRDGEISTLYSGSRELRQPGRYQLKVYDRAGNMAQYDFTIQFYLDINAGVAIALAAAALAAVLIYCYLVRRNARVG